MKHNAIHSFAAALTLLIASPLATSAQEYKIQMDFPAKVGDSYRIRSTGGETNQMAVSKDGTVVQRKATRQTWELDAEVKLTGVSDRNRPTRSEIVVRKLTLTADGRPTATPPAKTIILASIKDGDEHFTVNGEPADRAVASLLKKIFELDDGDASKQESFGTDAPKKVGDVWDANRDVMSKDAQRQGLSIKAADIAARTKLVKIAPVTGKPCAHLLVTGEVKNIKPPAPNGFSVKDGTMKMKLEFATPVDRSSPELINAQEMTTRMVMESTQQPGIVIDTTGVTRVASTFTRHPRP